MNHNVRGRYLVPNCLYTNPEIAVKVLSDNKKFCTYLLLKRDTDQSNLVLFLFAGRLQWTEEGLRQEGAGNRKKEEPAAAPVVANDGLERAGVPAPKDLFSGKWEVDEHKHWVRLRGCLL